MTKRKVSKQRIEQISSVIAQGISTELSDYIPLNDKEIGFAVLRILDKAYNKVYDLITDENKVPTSEDFNQFSIELPKVKGWICLERYYYIFINTLINQYVDIKIEHLKTANEIPNETLSDFMYKTVFGTMTGVQLIKSTLQNVVRKNLEIHLMKSAGIKTDVNGLEI